MSTATVTTIHPAVNPEQRKMIRRIRRIAKRHAFALSEGPQAAFRVWVQLQSAVVIAKYLTLEKALAICERWTVRDETKLTTKVTDAQVERIACISEHSYKTWGKSAPQWQEIFNHAFECGVRLGVEMGTEAVLRHIAEKRQAAKAVEPRSETGKAS